MIITRPSGGFPFESSLWYAMERSVIMSDHEQPMQMCPVSAMSASIDKLAAALIKAQSQIETAVKGATNPHFNSRYADLATCWECVKKPLTDNGLCLLQPASTNGNAISVTTILLHSSGQYIAETLSMIPGKDTPHAVGSCITYGRRYGLCAMLSLPQHDDDGNDASGINSRSKSTPAQSPDMDDTTENDREKTMVLLAKEIAQLVKHMGYSVNDVTDYLKMRYNVKRFSELTFQDAINCHREFEMKSKIFRKMLDTIRIQETERNAEDMTDSAIMEIVAKYLEEASAVSWDSRPFRAPWEQWKKWHESMKG